MASSGDNHGHEKHSPLEQFEISPFAHFETRIGDLAFTNSSLSMVITVLTITLFLTFTVNTRSIIPTRLQLMSEMSYNFIAQLINDTIGDQGKKYFPFILRLCSKSAILKFLNKIYIGVLIVEILLAL